MSDLFRREAVIHAARRLEGRVLLATPASAKATGGALVATMLAAIAFVSTATYSRKETLTGWLTPDLGVIRIASGTQGIVRQLLVREGDVVEAGQRIAEIVAATEIAGGNLGDLVGRDIAAEREALRGRYAARLANLAADEKKSSRRLASVAAEIAQLQSQIELQDKRRELARSAVTQSEGLAARGVVTRREFESRSSAALAAEQEIIALGRQLSALEREKDEHVSRLAAIPIDRANIDAERQAAVASLSQRAIDAEAKRAQWLTAPVAGRIAMLSASPGQAVSPASVLAIATPVGSRLEGELLAPSRSAGFIRKGQQVRLQLQAFPHQRFGSVAATIKQVSSTVQSPSEISMPGLAISEPVFRVRVELERDSIDAYGVRIPLRPGMLLAASVIVDNRSLIRWLFDPIYAVTAGDK